MRQEGVTVAAKWVTHMGTAALAGLALVAGSAAAAATSATASLSGLVFELVDLDTADGQAPRLTWLSPFSMTDVTAWSGQTVTYTLREDGALLWSTSFEQATSDTHESESAFLASVSSVLPQGTASVGGASLSTDVQAPGSGALVTGLAYAQGFFVLSPQTELRVTGWLSTAIAGPGSEGFLNPPGVAPDAPVAFSEAYAYAEVVLGAESALSFLSAASFTPNSVPADFPVDAYADSDGTALNLTFRNGGAQAAMGSFYVLVQTSVTQITSPVPEMPASWLALAGLAALVTRKRTGR